MIKRQNKLVLMFILLFTILLSGCLGCGPTSNSPTGSPTITPNTSVLPLATDFVSVLPGAVVTAAHTAYNSKPEVIIKENGYILRTSTRSDNPIEVELKAGKTIFQIKLGNYHLGDTYSLLLTSIDEPFSYKSKHEFTGDRGAGDIRITMNIPMGGTYQISIDYPDYWEVEITQ